MEKHVQNTQDAPWLQGDFALGENKNILDSYYQMVGNCISLANIHISTQVHNI